MNTRPGSLSQAYRTAPRRLAKLRLHYIIALYPLILLLGTVSMYVRIETSYAESELRRDAAIMQDEAELARLDWELERAKRDRDARRVIELRDRIRSYVPYIPRAPARNDVPLVIWKIGCVVYLLLLLPGFLAIRDLYRKRAIRFTLREHWADVREELVESVGPRSLFKSRFRLFGYDAETTEPRILAVNARSPRKAVEFARQQGLLPDLYEARGLTGSYFHPV